MKTIAFDLGGVLFAEGTSVAIEKLERDHHYDRKIVSDLLHSPTCRNLRKGLIDDKAFWDWAQRQLPGL